MNFLYLKVVRGNEMCVSVFRTHKSCLISFLNSNSGIRAPFGEGYDRGKSFRLKGDHDELMDSDLRGSDVVYKCELYVPHRIKE